MTKKVPYRIHAAHRGDPVAANHLLVIGDSRHQLFGKRSVGPVPIEDVCARFGHVSGA
jgi:hypothetical protein